VAGVGPSGSGGNIPGRTFTQTLDKHSSTSIYTGEKAGVPQRVVAYETEFHSIFKWQPTAEVRGDNLQANVWSGVKSMGNEKARAITKLQCELKMQTDIGFKHPHIKGKEDLVANGFSRKEWDVFLASFKFYSPVELDLLKQPNLDSRPLRLR
jgi:hypothetical protein